MFEKFRYRRGWIVLYKLNKERRGLEQTLELSNSRHSTFGAELDLANMKSSCVQYKLLKIGILAVAERELNIAGSIRRVLPL